MAYPYEPYGILENHGSPGSPVMFHLETMVTAAIGFEFGQARPFSEMRSTSDGGQGGEGYAR